MPAENEFERSVQSMLDGLQVNPAPSDWQAVYEQLHPTKKRRIIWWWLPVLLALVVAGLWMRNEPTASSRQQVLTAVPVDQKNKNSTDVKIDNAPESNSSQPAIPEITAEEATDTKANKQEIAAANNEDGFSTSSKNQIQSLKGDHTAGITSHNSSATNNLSEVNPDSESANPSLLTLLNSPAATTVVIPAAIPAPFENVNPFSAKVASGTTAKTQLKRPHAWQWLLYTGAGINITGSTLSMAKAAQDFSTGAPANVSVVTQVQQSNGWMANAGLMAQHALGRRWQLQAGVGFNYGTWSGSSQTYRDSFATSPTVMFRSLVQAQNTSYHAIMLELPIHFHYKLAGQKNNTWWLAAGVNNQFVLAVNEKTNTQQLAQSRSLVDNKSITGTATTWQPQLRAGFVFDRQGKQSHWQLSPMANYSMSSFFKSSGNNMALHNLQLQFRYFLNKR